MFFSSILIVVAFVCLINVESLFDLMSIVPDNSPFSELQHQMDSGFRLLNKFAVFLYSQLQNILPDQTLGSISDWDGYLRLDLDKPDLPCKTASEFVLNVDFHNLVIASKLPRPIKFIAQSIAFCKSLGKISLNHELVSTDLIRELSSFDIAVIIDGPERHYINAVEKLTLYFVDSGWIFPSDKVKCVSQYRSFTTKLRVDSITKATIGYNSLPRIMKCKSDPICFICSATHVSAYSHLLAELIVLRCQFLTYHLTERFFNRA